MKKVLIAFMCCAFAVAMAVSGCSKKEAATDNKDKAATEEKAEKGAEKAAPAAAKVSGPEAAAQSLCDAGMAGDASAIIDLMPPAMLEATAEMMAQFSEEEIDDPIEALKQEIADDMAEEPMEACSIGAVEESECGEEITMMFEQLGLDAPTACANVEITVTMGGDEDTDTMQLVEIDGSWYMAGGM